MRRFTVVNAPQRSADWFAARLGRVTASRAKDMLATIKSGEAAARRDYRFELVCERLTGQSAEDAYVTTDMQRGLDLEADAFAAYEARTGVLADRVGFCAHTEILAGGSPDGVIGDFTGLLEIKAPRPANHLRYLRSGTLPKEHEAQVTHLLWLTGAEWLDFLSYSPVFPPHLQTMLVRVEAKYLDLEHYERQVRTFLEDVELELAGLRGWSVLEIA